MAHDIFVSYSQPDRQAAEKVCGMLEKQGFSCWIAPRDILPSMTWAASIVRAIKQCRVMVLIFSSHANQSDQIPREVSLAEQEHVHVIPVRTENIRPAGDLEYYLPSTQWLDLFPAAIESYEAELARVVKAILSQSRPVPPEDPPSPPPPPREEWAKPPQKAPPPAAGSAVGSGTKVAIAVAYFLPYGIISIILLFADRRGVVRFHAWQSLFFGLLVDVIAVAAMGNPEADMSGAIGVVVVLSWIVGIAFCMGKKLKFPVVGQISERLSGAPG